MFHDRRVPLAAALGRECDCRLTFEMKPVKFAPRMILEVDAVGIILINSQSEDTGGPKPPPVAPESS